MFMISGTDPLPNLPRRLKELRQELGWTLEDVAERVGVTQRGVASNWEATNQRRRIPPITTLLALQRWYGVSMDYLLGHPDAERDSPAVKRARKNLREQLRSMTELEKIAPSNRARRVLTVAMELSPEVFFLERVAAYLFLETVDLVELMASGLWTEALVERLAAILGLKSEWFYSLEPVEEASRAE
ncbi:MAG: Helix-turn-helix domain [Symbiobacteriaceae bacterium]|nr:Helix-turn-helix domain [Symbiobacteriaceae bacterium]